MDLFIVSLPNQPLFACRGEIFPECDIPAIDEIVVAREEVKTVEEIINTLGKKFPYWKNVVYLLDYSEKGLQSTDTLLLF